MSKAGIIATFAVALAAPAQAASVVELAVRHTAAPAKRPVPDVRAPSSPARALDRAGAPP